MKVSRCWISIVIVVGILAGCTSGTKPPEPMPAVEVADYPGNANQLLVSATWLSEQLLSSPRLVILDASALEVYRGGHIPGAVHAWWQDAMDPNGAVYGTILKPDENQPDPQRLRKNLIEDLGVTQNSQNVIYDDVNNRDSAKLLWMLTFLGYPNTSLLDGGLAAWRGIDGEIEQSAYRPASVKNPPIAPQQDRYVWKDQVLERLGDPSFVLVDIRTDEERADDIDGTIVPGSIPGSVAVSWKSLTDPATGRLLEPDTLQALFNDVGITRDLPVLLYGRFGLESAFTWFALTLLGYPTVLIYDGGWAEWAQDQTTPKVLLNGQEAV